VKLERSVSPVGSVISATGPVSGSFRAGSHQSQPITYAGIKKKKKSRPLESDDEGTFGSTEPIFMRWVANQ
jgi:hypothetical protein